MLFSRRNYPQFKKNTAAKDKLTGSLAPAMSWNGNISHKGFHMHGACCPKYLKSKNTSSRTQSCQIKLI